MRISGTDAISLNMPKTGGTDAAPLNAPKRSGADASAGTAGGNMSVATKETKSKETDLRNISQLSDYEKKELPISERVVIDAIERANRAISGANRRFEFSIHEKTKEIMVKVIDSDTNEVIREIPPEKILDMVAKLWEMAGLIVDERR